MIEYIVSIGPWAWVAAAVLLIVLETMVPGVHFLWFGLAAAATGLVAFATPLSVGWQLVLFFFMAIAMVLVVRSLAVPKVAHSDEPALNIRGAQYVGRKVLVEEPISGGRGKVRVGDTMWQAAGPDVPKGAHVVVTGSDGTVLKVEAA